MRATTEYDLTAAQRAALRDLHEADDELTLAHEVRRDAVRTCRAQGLSWELIARELTISRQAAWEQFSRYEAGT
jgi:hypothetical protein